MNCFVCLSHQVREEDLNQEHLPYFIENPSQHEPYSLPEGLQVLKVSTGTDGSRIAVEMSAYQVMQSVLRLVQHQALLLAATAPFVELVWVPAAF